MSDIRTQECRTDDGQLTLHREKPSRRLGWPKITYQVPLPAELGGGLADAWENEAYYGLVRRHDSGFPVGGGPYAILSISSIHNDARHDWRDFQQLKNLLLGEEWEGVELYPAESRLVDPSNRYYLWCVPKGVLAWGFTHRNVCGIKDNVVPQRPFPEDRFP